MTSWILKFCLILPLLLCSLSSCMDEPVMEPNTHEGNFEALWKIIDTRYCFLDERNIDWDSIRTVYKQRIRSGMTDFEFFDLLGAMLGELKDGHVNLSSSFDISRYWNWFPNSQPNFSSSLIFSDRYLGDHYKIAGGLQYQKIGNNYIGYIYYGSFSNGFTDTNMHYIMTYFQYCRGLIIDVRDNGGGSLATSEQLASYFFKNDTVTGYIRHKTGNGHTDFSEPTKITTKANKNIQWERPVIVLTNRKSYSATNDFVNRMRLAKNAMIVGDITGGGGGLPFSSELPNGWSIRFSASPMYDASMEQTEFGIYPNIKIDLDSADVKNGYDTMIEKSIQLMNEWL